VTKKTIAKTPSSTTKTSKSQGEILITENEAWDVLKFAQELYKGIYTPQLVNQIMQTMTMNPQEATTEKITAALSDPKNNEQQLIGYSEFEELTSMLYKRILYYFSGLISFNFSYSCTNAEEKDYVGKAYQKDLAIVADFFDKFDLKQEFRNVIKQLFRQEAHFSIFRNDGTYKYVLQELPQNRCLIDGRWEMGILYSFDMMFFMQAGTDIQMFPPIFKTLFNRAFGNANGTNLYDPAKNINLRNGNWTYYVQTSPKDNFWCFKLIPEVTTRVPYLSPLLKDVVLQDMIRALQTNSYIAEATKLLAGGVPFLKDAKASVKDSISLNPDTLGKFLQLMKSGLSEAIKVIAAPLDNISALEYTGNDNLYNSYLKNTAGVSGVNSRLLFTTDRQNVVETTLSMDIDINVLRPVLTQFENFLNYFVNQNTKKFEFKFHLNGFNTTLDRKERMQNAKDFMQNGIVIDQMIANAIDMTPFDFRRQLAETRANDFVSKLTPILMAAQTPAGGGRPSKPESDLSDGGADSKADGTNAEKNQGG